MEIASPLPPQKPQDLNFSSPQVRTQPDMNPPPLANDLDTHVMPSDDSHLDQLRCRSCARLLAIVSPEGLDPASVTEGCVICQHFQTLYDAMQAAEERYAIYHDRRDTYAPKIDAYLEFKKTKLEFNNWLLSVEANASDAIDAETGLTTVDEGGDARGTKRGRSSSPMSAAQTPNSPPKSPNTARNRKRLKFSDTVEFRDEYRPSTCFSRSDDAYSRGRYAAPEGEEHLDTSGLALTHLKFSGMKRVGSKWVDVWEEVNDPERSKKKGKKKPADEDVAEVEVDGALWETLEEQVSDSRTQRLARRKNGISTRKHIAVRSKNSGPGNGKIKSANQAEDQARLPIGTSSRFAEGPFTAAAESEQHLEQEASEDVPAHAYDNEAVEKAIPEGTAHVTTSAEVEQTSQLAAAPVEGNPLGQGEMTDQRNPTAAQVECAKQSQASTDAIDTLDTTAPAESPTANGKTQEDDSTVIDMQHILTARHQDAGEILNGQGAIADRTAMESPPGEAKSDVVEEILRSHADSMHGKSTTDRQLQTLDDSAHHAPGDTGP